jgi:hypothetical protein
MKLTKENLSKLAKFKKSQKKVIFTATPQDMDDTEFFTVKLSINLIIFMHWKEIMFVNSKLYLFGTLQIFKELKYMNVI